MSNTTYIEEVLKEFVGVFCYKYKGHIQLNDLPTSNDMGEELYKFFKSKLTQAIRDTEVKTAKEIDDHITWMCTSSDDWNSLEDKKIYTDGLYSVKERLDQIINTNQED